ncbi:helix-turn-helix domain-containing protein [Enterococcus casseliflavus]|uniref:helix-turn-helix domain-containing protein n=1 Tax=Enterococcus casseliflavus TaxID=37734 RepID=UPI00254339E6|nr:helix-turn-helix domain-containing protein [Enterococcus casseliflavus]MDK4450920.1 helix-turn-helix domain-containing protein [Enterococcus casseliflavus]
MKNFQLNFVTNKSKVRWIQILNYLEKHSVATSQELSEYLEISQRTVITEVLTLKEDFKTVIDLISSPAGYHFTKLSSNQYLEKKRSILQDEPLFVIMEALFYNDLHSVGDWAERLYISEKTLINHLGKVKKELNTLNLDLSVHPVNIIGSEIDIRYFFTLFYYESDITPHTVFPPINAEEATTEFMELIDVDKFHSSSFSYFSYLLFISMERIKQGKFVSIDLGLKKIIKKTRNYNKLLAISQMIIRDHFEENLKEDEFVYMFTSLLTMRNLENLKKELNFVASYNHWPRIHTLAEDFQTKFDLSFNGDTKELIFIEAFFTVIKLKELISASTLKNMNDVTSFSKEKFKQNYQSYYTFLKENEDFKAEFSNDYLADITANLVLFVETVKETYWLNPQSIVFVFEGNHYIFQYFESTIKSILGPHHNLYFPNERQLTSQYIKEHNIDIIVSNYPEVFSDDFDAKQILFNTIPDAEDWNRLFFTINPKIIANYRITDQI